MHKLAEHIWGEEETEAILGVLHSTQVTMGPRVKQFEEDFSRFLGVDSRKVVMVGSGSAANLAAVDALIWSGHLTPGDSVIVPAISWSTTYAPLQQRGMHLQIVDVQPNTLTIDVDKVREAITERTKMVVVVNILGNPANLFALRKLCDDHGLIMFEDNCESIGATVQDERGHTRVAGTMGDIGTFSFFHTHQMSTGEGGAVVTHDTDIADCVRSLRSYGWTRGLGLNSSLIPLTTHTGFKDEYCFIYPGYNLKPLEFQGAVGSVQLNKLAGMLTKRRANATLFKLLFDTDHSGFTTQATDYGYSSWFGFTLVPATPGHREEIIRALEKNDIELRLITGGNFLSHPYTRHFDYTFSRCPNAKYVHAEGFFVGNTSRDLTNELRKLAEVLKPFGK